MKKVLVIISDNNKGKFIAKGFSSAFKKFSFFVYEKKVYDLNADEVRKINPDLVFIFWTDMRNKDTLEKFFQECNLEAFFCHCAENKNDIPSFFLKKKNHYIWSENSKTKKNKYVQPISALDYKASFDGYKYNITFCGNPAYKNREEILSELIKNFGAINIFCRSFDFYTSLDNITERKLLDEDLIELYRKSYRGYVEQQRELANIYLSSKINLDMESSNIKDTNYRLREITAAGGFVIAPYNINLVKQYEDGKEIETYKNVYELIDKINFYLNNLNIAKSIAVLGKKNTISNFSYYDKLKVMLKVIYGKNFGS